MKSCPSRVVYSMSILPRPGHRYLMTQSQSSMSEVSTRIIPAAAAGLYFRRRLPLQGLFLPAKSQRLRYHPILESTTTLNIKNASILQLSLYVECSMIEFRCTRIPSHPFHHPKHLRGSQKAYIPSRLSFERRVRESKYFRYGSFPPTWRKKPLQ
ncbi:hypothetical protein L218DRAFT_577669 [Marasmius fiardii PR-910]|nr:hypothetical protein L218DRAFT_577669 [Marasmius fiardii PR-910]